jgi:ABC-2 type transport system permease protein
MVSGFNIVDERDSMSVRALAVSPAGFANYLLAKGIVASGIGIFMSIVSMFIMKVEPVSIFQTVLALVAMIRLAMAVALFLGALASNQIAAIGVVKFLLPVLLTVPIVSIFVAPKWQPIFYVFPNYWTFLSLKRLFLPDEFAPVGFYPAMLLSLATGAALVTALVPFSRKKLGIR